MPCGDGLGCAVAADCQSAVCQGMPLTCQVATCSDMAKNGAETGEDCGGPCPTKCGAGEGCSTGDDCIEQVCDGGACAAPACGDGVTNGLESCDDGNAASGDGCSSFCILEIGYACAGTPSMCTSACGDGVVAADEGCDDGSLVNGDGCSATCQVEPTYSCAGSPSACSPGCGDGLRTAVEPCDDGNAENGDCCSSACQIEPGCEVEQNGTIPAANTFGAISLDGKHIKGFVSPPGEADVFAVVVPVGSSGTLTAATIDGFLGTTCGSHALDSHLTIYDENGVVLGADDDGGPGFCSLVTAQGLAPGTYYVEVTASPVAPPTMTFDYTLAVTLGPPGCGNGIEEAGEGCDDGNLVNGDGCSDLCVLETVSEIEPNGTKAEADMHPAFPIDELIKGAVSPATDLDFFAVVLPATADLRIETFDAAGPGSCVGVDTVIDLRAANGTTVLASDDESGLGSCSLIDPTVVAAARHLAPGTYYVRVKSFTGVIPVYTLLVSYDALCGDGIEEGSEACDGGAGCDAHCNLLPVCGDGTVSGMEGCDDGNLVNGDGCSSTCQLEGAPGEVEPNDTIAQASTNGLTITGDDLRVGSIGVSGDKDLYAVSVATGSVVRFETFDTVSPRDCATASTQLKLLGSTGTQLKVDNVGAVASGINNCGALVVFLAAGTYYIQVDKPTSGTVAKYYLETTFAADKGSEVEANDTSATATPLAGADSFIAGDHMTPADTDFYAVTVPAGKSIRAEVIEGDTTETCEALGIDSVLTLLSPSAVVLGSDNDDGRGYCSAIDGTGATPRDAFAHNLAAGTYFLRVTSYGMGAANGNQFNYRLATTVR